MRNLALAVTLIAIYGCSHDQIAIYSLLCDKPLVNGECRSAALAYPPRYFKVFPDQQRAITWVESFPPQALTRCVIRDVRNWSCRYDDDSARFEMANGRLNQWNPKIIYVGGTSESQEFQTNWIVWQEVRFGASYQSGIVQLLKAVTF